MSIKIGISETIDLKPKIVVLGVGGAGGNAVNNMIKSNLDGVDFWVANTDAQALANSLVPEEKRIQLGIQSTFGLGAGSHPEVGARAAEESISELQAVLETANMCFITAGMGGGTGTGAAPVIAKLARDMGILTVGVVTKPFQFEGARRMRLAEAGLNELQQHVDTLIIIPNQNLFRVANEKTTFSQAFGMADEVLHSGVRSITDLITYPGIVNLDFADIKTVMFESGKAMMGTGEADGETRAINAAENAISNPLLDISSMKGAQGVLINISGGDDMTLYELDAAANRIREEVDGDANIIVGSAFNESLDGKIRVSVVATGIDQELSSVFDNSRINMDKNQVAAQAVNNAPQPETKQDQQDAEAGNNSHYANAMQEVMQASTETAVKSSANGDFTQKNQDNSINIANDVSDNMLSESDAEQTPAVQDVTHDNSGIFGNKSLETNQQPEQKTGVAKEQDNKKNDIFDIPAFLRRKIGKK